MPVESATNILPLRRNRLRDRPLCAQCRVLMEIDRCELDFENSISMVVSYRCEECGLLERARIQY
jgi:RNase P subunit RPR2